MEVERREAVIWFLVIDENYPDKVGTRRYENERNKTV